MVSNKMIVTLMLIAVTSLAAIGCSDDNPVTPNNIDTAPLIAPTDLTVEMDKGTAVLNWTPSLDTRVSSYVVIRERNGNVQNIGNTPLNVFSFVDSQPLNGSSMYHVYAISQGQQTSPMVTANLTISLQHIPAKLAR